MIIWILWCISVWGMSCLAWGMTKHQRELFDRKVSSKETGIFQIVGWTLLAASAITMIFIQPPSFGLPEWIGSLTFAALVVGLIVSYYPKKLMQINLAMSLVLVLVLAITWLI